MIDVGFPVLSYPADRTPRQWGEAHGETYRSAIAELVEIRAQLMREKNPCLTPADVDRLALVQWEITRQYDGPLYDELSGIVAGSNLTPQQLVILNNYTDFRDIELEDQGCSVIYIADPDAPIAGQTWDMHGSAKNFVCCIQIETESGKAQPAQVVFSLVGCLGLMGYTADGRVVGVNNINTKGARPGVLWPALVRKLLRCPDREAMVRELNSAPVTSGHNYLIADAHRGQMWEVLPGVSEKVADSSQPNSRRLFHTNHCLGQRAREQEQTTVRNSTTNIRYELIAKKIDQVNTFDDVYNLLNDHENYPKSICSNYQSDSIDPSITCGGAVGDLKQGIVKMWRGDPLYDANYVERMLELRPATVR